MGNKAFSDLITFTRASSGSYYAANGTLMVAAINEPRYDYNLNSFKYQNLFLQSQFASSWLLPGAAISLTKNSTSAPDGTITAAKITAVGGGSEYVYQNATFFTGTTYTVSVYVKRINATEFTIRSFQQVGRGIFNLAALTASADGIGSSAVISSVGGGWYRCSVVFTATSTGSNNIGYDTNSNAALGDAYYLWGAQLNRGSTILPYYPTTTTIYEQLNLAGILVEESRTNYVRNSSMSGVVGGTPGTLPTNWGYGASAGVTVTRQVIGTGTENGIPYVDVRIYGTTDATASPEISITFDTGAIIAATSGQTWTSTFYAKIVAGTLTGILNGENYVICYTSGAVLTEAAPAAFSYTLNAGNLRDNRIAKTYTTTIGTTAFIQNRIDVNLIPSSTVDFTIRVGLPQLELSAFATSPIHTSSAAVTRSADLMDITGTNFSTMFNSTQGTFYSESIMGATIPAATYNTTIGAELDATNRMVFVYNPANYIGMYVVTAGAGQADLGIAGSLNVVNKQAGCYLTNDFAWSLNGAAPLTDTSGTVPTGIDKLRIGNNLGTVKGVQWIRKVKYYPKRLTNAELQALTV